MNKKFILITLAFAALFLVACSGGQETETTTEETSTSVETPVLTFSS